MSTHQDRLAAFVDALSKEMMSFCGPIFITPGLKTYPREMIDNGTYSLIDTGQRRILVTCQHVWQAYLDYRIKNPEAVLAINLGDGDATIGFEDPERQLSMRTRNLTWRSSISSQVRSGYATLQ